jgi:hypothetical protein
MKVFAARAILFFLNAVVWIWAGVKFLLDWVGRSTVLDDFDALLDSLPRTVSWLYETPGWLPAVIATCLSVYLAWLTWPRKSTPEGYEEMLSQHRLLRSRLESALAVQPVPGAPLVRTWADETTALRSEISWGVYQFIFEQPLRCPPAIHMLDPIPGTSAHVQEIRSNGFNVYFSEYQDDFPIRFFADARETNPEYDPLEDALNGRWLGNRFVFREPKTIHDEMRNGEYHSSLELAVKPCPPGSVAEVEYQCDLGLHAFGLSDGKKVIYGSGVASLVVNEKQSITFAHYPAERPITVPFNLQLRLLSWRHSGKA